MLPQNPCYVGLDLNDEDVVSNITFGEENKPFADLADNGTIRVPVGTVATYYGAKMVVADMYTCLVAQQVKPFLSMQVSGFAPVPAPNGQPEANAFSPEDGDCTLVELL